MVWVILGYFQLAGLLNQYFIFPICGKQKTFGIPDFF